MEKRGLSDLIVTVLIVLLALAGVSIVWFFFRGSFEDTGSRYDAEIIFLTTEFEIIPGTFSLTDDNNVSFVVERRGGNGNITGFIVVLEDIYAETKAINKYNETSMQILQRARVDILNYEHGLGNITKISIYGITIIDGEFIISDNPLEIFETLNSGARGTSGTTPEQIPEGAIFIDSGLSSDCVNYSVEDRMCGGGNYTVYRNLSSAAASSGSSSNTSYFLFRQGEYIVNPPLNIYRDNLTLKSYSNENVVIRGGIAQWDAMIKFLGNNYVIDELTFIGNYNNLYVPNILEFGHPTGRSNVKIYNSKFLDFQGNDDIGYGLRFPASNATFDGDGWGSAIHFYKVNDIEIKNSEFQCLSDPSKMTPDWFQGDGILCDYCSDTIIENNIFGNCPHISLTLRALDYTIGENDNVTIRNNDFSNKFHTNLAFGGTNFIVYNNKIHDFNSIPSYNGSPGAMPTAAGIIFGGASETNPSATSNNLVYNNLIYNGFGMSWGIALSGGTNAAVANTDNKIYHNTIYDMGEMGFYISNSQGTGGNTGIYNNKFYNNIIYGAGISNRTNVNGVMVLIFNNFEENNGYGNEFYNNIITPYDGRVAIMSNYIFTPRYNYTAEEFNSNFTFADGNTNITPQFIIPGSDLHLGLEIPVPCLSEVSQDIEGMSRAGICTAGAYEFA